MGHSRSLKITTLYVSSSYSSSIVTKATCCIVSQIKRDVCRKSRFLSRISTVMLTRDSNFVCPSVCLSRSGIVSQRLKVLSHFLQHMHSHHSSFPIIKHLCIIPTGLPTGAVNTGGVYKFCDFLSNQPRSGTNHGCHNVPPVKNYPPQNLCWRRAPRPPPLRVSQICLSQPEIYASSRVKTSLLILIVLTLCVLLTR